MKICILSPNYLLIKGGVETITYHMANELSSLGHEIHVISIEESVKQDREDLEEVSDFNLLNKNFHVHEIHLPFQFMVQRYYKIRYILFNIFAFIEVGKIRPHIVHAQEFGSSLSSLLSKFFFGIPYAIGVHKENFSLNGEFVLPLHLKKYWPSLPHIKHSEIIFALKDETKMEIEKYLNKKSVTIPNGVDLNLFKPEQIRLTSQPAVPNIVCVSRLEEGKGVECALYAMGLVLHRYPNSRLTIIGDGTNRKKLENLVNNLNIGKNVKFIGQIPNFEIPNYFRSANIYILTSFSEGFSVSLLEAMASGLPIISTPVGIAPKICMEWNNGYLVPIRDYHAIYEAIIKLIESIETMSMFSKNSAEKAKEYRWNTIIKDYEKEYYKILFPYQQNNN